MLSFLIRTLLEPACVACEAVLDRPLNGPVCDGCWRAVPRLTPPCCERCGDALPSWRAAQPLCARCRRQPAVIELAQSAGVYDGSLRDIVHAFKYGGRRMLARPLAELMREQGRQVLALADAVVPVPLHPWRRFRRGFNQADDLARHLGPPVWRTLRRRRNGAPQAGLPASQRHANVRGAFALSVAPHRYRLDDRVLVLVDDVMTTGATLDACARVLRDAGARSVRALTIARAVAGRPDRLPPIPDLSTARRQ